MGSGAAGTGPFKIVNFDTSTYSVRLEAFEQYWGGTPQIKNVLFRNNKDPQARFEALKSGQADIVDDLARNQWSEVTGDFRLVSFWAPNICYLGMNCKHEKTKEKAIREAIRLAIDQNELLPLYNNTARPNYSMLPQTFVEYDANYRAPGLLADMETRRTEAKKLLESAGALGREIKISHPKDDRPYLPGPSKIADKIKQQLNAVGFKAIANGVKNDEFFRQVSLGVYELILIGWMSDNGDPDNFYGPLTDGDDSGKPSFNNTSCSMDMKVHEMLRAAQLATDDATRISIYRNVERRLQEEVAGYVPLVNTQQAIALGKRIEGVVVDSLGMYYLSSAKFRK
ncbi:MAG: hypothetical protein HUU29_14670 [Planctomycetaceae bacterium]|nr:hypothetical protein [Planctomycetaceae bacterium]